MKSNPTSKSQIIGKKTWICPAGGEEGEDRLVHTFSRGSNS